MNDGSTSRKNLRNWLANFFDVIETVEAPEAVVEGATGELLAFGR